MIDSGLIFTPIGWMEGRIRVAGDVIVGIDPDGAGSPFRLVPGFIDAHVHGADGADVMDATDKALAVMARAMVRHGTTAFLAATLTAPREAIAAALAVKLPADGARCLGFHLEGPAVSHAMRGAQPAESIRVPEAAEVDDWIRSEVVRLVTVAPEIPGGLRLIERLTHAGIAVNLGHSAATWEEGRQGLDAGATGYTHLFNGMSGLHHRAPGLVGLALDGPGYIELIADGVHVAPPVVRVVMKAAPGRVALITDAMRAQGLAPGDYYLGSVAVTVRDGAVREARGNLAGSVLTQGQALQNALQWGIPWDVVVPALSDVPARRLGLTDAGRLAAGARADWVVVDNQGRIHETVIGGRMVYHADPA